MNTLEICGVRLPAPDSAQASDWQSVSYALYVGARDDAGANVVQHALQQDDILLLELDNGMQWLLPAEDASAMLGAEARDADSASGVLRLGAQLDLGDPRARDGVGAWLLKSLTVFQ